MSNVCFETQTNEIFGRHIVATRDIAPGEIIMKVAPLVLGPKTVSPPLCLTCHKKLDLRNKRYECRKCLWPLCGEECENSLLHAEECRVLTTSGYRPTVQTDGKQSVYSCITPLRALLLKKNEPEKFAVLMECQAHLQEHAQTAAYQVLRRTLVPFFRSVLKLDTDDTEVRAPDVNIRGLFPVVSLLAHDCKHNTKHTFGDDFTLTLTATVKIKKGDLITATYTQTLWGTQERRAHLRAAKHFDCSCQRCNDPTEFGTFIGSFNCDSCGGKLLNSDSEFCCNNCGVTVNSEAIASKTAAFKREVSQLNRDPESFEEFLERHSEILHGKNSLSLQVKYALTQLYGNIEHYNLEGLLERKIELCEELLAVAEVLEPGLSRFRGLLLYDLFQALIEKVKRGEMELKERALGYLIEAHEILKTEPDVGEVVEQDVKLLLSYKFT